MHCQVRVWLRSTIASFKTTGDVISSMVKDSPLQTQNVDVVQLATALGVT